MKCFVATSAFFALLDRDNKNHSPAEGILRKLFANDNVLITINYVLIEYLVHVPDEHDSRCSHEVRILGTAPPSYFRFSRLFNTQNILVDCVNFAIMFSRSIQSALTFEDHFREQGFDMATDWSMILKPKPNRHTLYKRL